MGRVEVKGEFQAYVIELVAGTSVDVLIHPHVGEPQDPLQYPYFRIVSPTGTVIGSTSHVRRPEHSAYVFSHQVQESGAYRIEVTTSVRAGRFMLKTPEAGGVLLSEILEGVSMVAEGGSAVVDTLWLWNTGPEPMTWTLVSDLPSWLQVNPTSGTIPGSAIAPGPAPARPAATGAMPAAAAAVGAVDVVPQTPVPPGAGTVGKDITRFTADSCDVAPDDGAAFTGRISALDALVILAHSVGRELSERYRVGRTR